MAENDGASSYAINMRGNNANGNTLQSDPLRNFRFLVKFWPYWANDEGGAAKHNPTLGSGSHTNSSVTSAFGFTSVSGLTVATEAIPYREGGMNAQPLSSKVLTNTGWKRMGDVKTGDQVIDPNGESSKVEGVYPQGERDVYEVTLRDGSTTRACNEHLWEIQTQGMSQSRVIDTLEMKERLDSGQLVYLPAIESVEFESLAELPIHPYILGVLISEGSLSNGAQFCSSEYEIAHKVLSLLPDGHSLRSHGFKNSMHAITVGQGGAQTNRTTSGRNLITKGLRDLGLFGKRSHEKFIPDEYLFASREDRLELLRGIMDGNGSCSPRANGHSRVTLSSASEQLRDDVVSVINSLGGRATTRTQTGITYTSPTQKEPKAAKDAHIISGVRMLDNPFYMSRKADMFEARDTKGFRRVAAIELVGREEVQCIKVSAQSHLYVTDDYIPTHNTTLHQVPGQTTFSPVTLSRGVHVGNKKAWRWMRRMFSVTASNRQAGNTNATPGVNFRASVDIMVLNHPPDRRNDLGGPEASNAIRGSSNDNVAVAFRLYNAWISSLAYSDLNAGDNAIMVEQMVLAHEGFDMYWAEPSTKPEERISVNAAGASIKTLFTH